MTINEQDLKRLVPLLLDGYERALRANARMLTALEAVSLSDDPSDKQITINEAHRIVRVVLAEMRGQEVLP